jgi:PilZ domain
MLLQTLPSAAEFSDPGIEVERRTVVRYLCDRKVFYAPLWTSERRWARIRNVSVTGISLLVAAAIKPGTDLAIDMKTVEPGILLTLVARVVHATKQDEGNWIIGCTFLSGPREEPLRALL